MYPINRIRFIVPFLIFSAGLLLSAASTADALDESDWRQLKTDHAVVRYQSIEDLQRLLKKLDFGPEPDWSLRRTLFGLREDETLDAVKRKVDAIYRRVQNLLGMNRRLRPVNITLHPDRNRLTNAYYSTFDKPGTVRAWYVFDDNTIHICAEDVHAGMLAHEMAHAVVDNYLMMRPPAATAEILARFVDRNLGDERVMPLEDHPDRAVYRQE